MVETFVVPDKRRRYKGFLTSPKRRKKFLDELYHFGTSFPAAKSSCADPPYGQKANRTFGAEVLKPIATSCRSTKTSMDRRTRWRT